MSDYYEVATLLRVRDEATAQLQRFIATLREVQAQVDTSLAGLRRFRNALAPSAAALGRQREALGLTQKEADLRAGLAAETTKQSEAMLAARRASLDMAGSEAAVIREQLASTRSIAAATRDQIAAQQAIQRNVAPAFIPAFKKAGSNLMWGGAGIIGGLAYATQQAIDFNQTALETDMALGGYTRTPAQRTKDVRALQQAAFAGSEATGFFSAQQILEGLKKAASAGARPLVEKMGMGTFTAIAPSLSRYMDVLGRLKGESADQAATEAIQTAHQFGAYTPAAINRTLNAQAALALLMPDTMSKAVTTGAYVASTGLTLAGMSQDAILALMATADQSGIGKGRAGSRLQNYIETIAVTQSKTRERAKHRLGIEGAIDRKTSSLDIMKSFDILMADRNRMGAQAFRDAVRTAFGQTGSIIAALFGDPNKVKMFEANRKVIGQAVERGDLTTIQNLLKGSVAGQEALAWTRLKNDIIQFGQYGVPIALKFFDTINPKLKQFSSWVDEHPDDAKRFFDNALKVGEAMLALGAAFKVITGIAGTIAVVRAISGTIGRLVTVGRYLAGLNAPAESAAVGLADVSKSLTGFGTARAAAAGLLALGGAVAVVSASVAFWYGIKKDLDDAKHNPKLAKQLQWGASGANYGIPPPPGTTGQDVDVFGRPVSPHKTVVPHSLHPRPVSAYKAEPWQGFGRAHAKMTPPVVQAQPSSSRKHATNDKVTVQQTVNISMNLPKDSDAANARRIAQYVSRLTGAYHSSPAYSIPPGAYNAGLALG